MRKSAVRAAALRADERRARALVVLASLAVAGTLALGVLAAPGEGGLIDLQLAQSADDFAAALRSGWLHSDDTALCGIGAEHSASGPSFRRLRCNVFVDSVVFVPGYVGLLVFFVLITSGIVGIRSVLAVHLMCFVPVAMAFFDVAENAMTVRAADDWAQLVLADGTVADVRLASMTKWGLGAVSFAVLAVLGARAALSRVAEGRGVLTVAALASGVAAVLFAAGVSGAPRALAWGMVAALAALLALVAWQWRMLRRQRAGEH